MLSHQEIGSITAFLDVEVETTQADVAFHFGGRYEEPIHRLAQLYKDHRVGRVVLTGGVNRVNGMHEAITHRDILLEAGVPPERLIVETQSVNTVENVVFALPLIAAQLDLEHVQSILVVTKWYHARRAIMTLRRYFPDGIRYFTDCYEPPDSPRRNWHEHPMAVRRVLKEWDLIPKLLEAGFLAPIERTNDGFI